MRNIVSRSKTQRLELLNYKNISRVYLVSNKEAVMQDESLNEMRSRMEELLAKGRDLYAQYQEIAREYEVLRRKIEQQASPNAAQARMSLVLRSS